MAAATKTRKSPSRDRYLDLVRAFPLRPIRTADAHGRAKQMLRGLSGARNAAAADFKTVLISLIAAYEREAGHRLDTSNLGAADIVRHLLAERCLSVNAFAKTVGLSQSGLSDMLNGRRAWSKSAIVKVADYFGLEPGLFLR